MICSGVFPQCWISGCASLLADRNRVELRQRQSRRLRALVRHAYDRVPYYHELFRRVGLEPEEIQTLGDLEKIPLTSRADLQNLPLSAITARGIDPAELVEHSTGGSSGHPMIIRRTRFEERLLQAFRLRVLFRLGLRPTDRRANIVALDVPQPTILARWGFLPYEPVDCLLPAAEILSRLREIRPDVLRGYASALASLADEMTEGDRAQIRPRFVTSDSETLTQSMRARIRAGFRAPVIDFYDSNEFNLIAAEDPVGGGYRVCEESVLAEVLRDGRAAGPGEEGELVGTALHSWAMPFLRYRQGDLVTRGTRPGTLARIQGRVMDRFELVNGRSLHPYALEIPILEHLPDLQQFQIVQERPEYLRIRVVLPGGGGAERIGALERRLAAEVGAGMVVAIQRVESIPAGANGKFRPYYRA